ncbi:ABC transporter substrate-binding protein [Micrococcales bacterium 31B]|nr:ABC transporter substrate-binding protein [Micrococcales bacterium 31B]
MTEPTHHTGTREVQPAPPLHTLGATRRMMLGLGSLAVLGAATGLLGSREREATAQTVDLASGTGTAPHVNLSFFANLTHAPGLVAEQRGLLKTHLGSRGTTVSTQVMDSGPATVEAISAGAVDAAYLGPTPALNSYLKSKGRSLFIIAGATSGGSSLVVRPEYDTEAKVINAAKLTLATQQIGGTPDVALRLWLKQRGVVVDPRTGHERINITAVTSAQAFAMYQQGVIDGGWIVEPWATKLVEEVGAKRLVDERTLWPGGQYSATVLAVNQEFARAYPQTVRDLMAANAEAVTWLNANPAEGSQAIAAALDAHNAALPVETIAAANQFLTYTSDPLEATYQTLIDHAVDVGLAEPIAPTALDGVVNQPTGSTETESTS